MPDVMDATLVKWMSFDGEVVGIKSSLNVDMVTMALWATGNPVSRTELTIGIPKSPDNLDMYRKPLKMTIAVTCDDEEQES